QERSEEGDARTQTRPAEEREVGEDGQKSEAGDRYRPVEGTEEGGQGAPKEVVAAVPAKVAGTVRMPQPGTRTGAATSAEPIFGLSARRSRSGPVFESGHAVVLGAVGATVNFAGRLDAVANHFAMAVGTRGCQ